MREKNASSRVFLLGIDGLPIDYLNRLIGEGRLPTFEKLVSEGSSGILESTIPPLSVPAWPSIYTGLNPGNHGIYGFITQQRGQNQDYIFHNSDSIKGKTVWDIIGKNRKKSIIVNVPLTNPPYPINGVMISGFPSSRNKPKSYPKRVERTLRENHPDYIVDIEPQNRDYRKIDKEQFIDKAHELIRARTKVAIHLMQKEPWDFFFLVYTESDRLQHVFWPYVDESYRKKINDYDDYKDALPKFYEEIDQNLKMILESLPRDTTLMIVSDHGFESLYKRFGIKNWLQDHGLTKEKKPKIDRYNTVKNIYNWLKNNAPVNITDFYSILPKNLRKRGAQHFVQVGTGGINFIELDKQEPKSELHENLRTELLQIKDGENNIIHGVYRREEIYHGEYLGHSYDMIIMPNTGYAITQWNTDDMIQEVPWHTGNHLSHEARKGTLIIWGDNVKNIKSIQASCYDITPTVLYLLGINCKSEFDGHALSNLFRETHAR